MRKIILLTLLGYVSVVGGSSTKLRRNAAAGGASRSELMREMLSKAEPYYENEFERDVIQPHRKVQDYVDDMANDEYGFDMTKYSLKYQRCQAVKAYSDEAVAQGMSNVMVTESFVVFRLCPTYLCKSNKRAGCSSNYGQYVLPIDDYLYYMSVFNIAKEKHYCQWCKECFQNQNQRKMRKQRRGRRLDEDYEDADADYEEADAEEDEEEEEYEEEEDEVEEEEEEEENEEEEEQYEEYEEEDTSCPSECDNYYSRCEDDNDEDAIQYEDYLNCVKYRTYDQYGQRQNLYVGAYCASDHSTIKIDVFFDQFCTMYAGNEHNVNSITGLDFDESGLSDYYSGDCIPCKESELPYQNSEEDYEDDNTVSEICESLFEESGKCNKMLSQNSEQSYSSYVQYDNEKMTCNFIDNIVNNAYTQTGEIYTRTSGITYIDLGMATWQVVSLVFLTFGTTILAYMAFHLEPLVRVPNPGNKHLMQGPSHAMYFS